MTVNLEAARKDLDKAATLRAGINLGNILLVTGKAANGDPQGVSPDMAAALAGQLGVDIEYITYASPGELADAAPRDDHAAQHHAEETSELRDARREVDDQVR